MTLASIGAVLAASPSPAAHAILLGAIAVVAVGAFLVAKRRHKRDAARLAAELAEEQVRQADVADDDLS